MKNSGHKEKSHGNGNAEIIAIPKPGKNPGIEALRLISLTSCLGKVYERIIIRRLQNNLEDNDHLPHTMVGFREGLLTQDAFLLLKKEVLPNNPKGSEHIIMARAF